MKKNNITRTVKFDKGDIVFVVEATNTYIGTVTGEEFDEVVEIKPMYMKRKIKTNSMWTKYSNIKACFGSDKEKVLREYSEYFV